MPSPRRWVNAEWRSWCSVDPPLGWVSKPITVDGMNDDYLVMRRVVVF